MFVCIHCTVQKNKRIIFSAGQSSNIKMDTVKGSMINDVAKNCEVSMAKR